MKKGKPAMSLVAELRSSAEQKARSIEGAGMLLKSPRFQNE